MATLKKRTLTGSTNGRPIKITQTAIATGDTIHTALAGSVEGEGDEVTLYAFNSHTANVTLTLGLGGVTDPDDLIDIVLVPGGHDLALPGWLVQNSLVLKGAASVANVAIVYGWVIRSS